MKSFIALCFLAAICAIQASADSTLDKLNDEVETSKGNVASTMAHLGQTKGKLIESLNKNLNTLWSQSKLKIGNSLKLALDEIRAKIDAAKAEGKDAMHCYSTTYATLHRILGTVFSGFQACDTNGRSQLPQTLAPLDKAMATGQAYIPQLNSIIPECKKLSSAQIETCATEKLSEINESIKTYQSEEDKLILDAQTGVNDVLNAVSSCFKEPASTADSAIAGLTPAAEKCINN